MFKRGYKLIAGVDEAGRGPLAGPVVAAAVILKVRNFESIIRDSKLLSERQRQTAYMEIMDKAMVGIGIVGERIIDEINILQASLRAMRDAVWKLKLQPECVLVDGITPPETGLFESCLVNGESKSLSIACASIIAKVTRDEIMREYDLRFSQYGFARHKGYGTPQHLEALRRFGPSAIHRMSFSPCKKRHGER